MRSVTPIDLAGHCPRCLLNTAICLCLDVPRVVTRTRIVIVRHVAELRLSSNTGRFAGLALPNSCIYEYGAGEPFDQSLLREPDTALLYHTGPVRKLEPPPRQLIVLDGTFRQARRMYKRLGALRELPELALPPPLVPPLRLREPPHPGGMSTLEAIAHALALLEGEDVARPLHALQAELIRRVDALRGRRREAPTAAAAG